MRDEQIQKEVKKEAAGQNCSAPMCRLVSGIIQLKKGLSSLRSFSSFSLSISTGFSM
jgi:hypothetical protein